jgi:integrase
MAGLTDREIKAAIREAQATAKNVFRTSPHTTRGRGRLTVRAQPTGECLFYFRYVDPSGKRDSLPLGAYHEKGKGGLTLKEAFAKESELAGLYQAGHRDLRGYLQHEQAEQRERIERAAQQREAAQREAKTGTMKALLDGYVLHLQAQSKRESAGNVRSIFKCHVYEPFPEMAAMPASKVTRHDVNKLLARCIRANKGRTAAKLRSYGASAWTCAMNASSDPTVHERLSGFNVETNPFALVSARPLAKFNKPGDRTLTETELRSYIRAVRAIRHGVNGATRDALLLDLYLGGQRGVQMLRATPADVDMDARTVTIYDRKGRRLHPRVHVVPLANRAAEIMAARLALRNENSKPLPYIFTSDGKVHTRLETLSHAVHELCDALLNDGDSGVTTPFTFKDVRRTCETMFARMGVSSDIRAQVQSHGLGGVQNRHYDRHDYMNEKRETLEAWERRLAQIESGVTLNNVRELKRA